MLGSKTKCTAYPEEVPFVYTLSKIVAWSQWINKVEMLGNKGLALIFLAIRENCIYLSILIKEPIIISR